MSEVKQTLIAARALIEKGWTQDAYARDADGAACSVNDDRATCFCMNGAVMRVAGIYRENDALMVFTALGSAAGVTRYSHHWNDAPGRTQAEVLALFDKAIEAAQ